ncbi:MAG TPA: branched-chain amino acid aminotransferase [Acetobacteraceae bacterium]|nr:branched-chain amino acid aminotransferase [Acetobacteraceae bacterium]
MKRSLEGLTVRRVHEGRRVPEDATARFGTTFSDHMFRMEYEAGRGWHDPRIAPMGELGLGPATSVLHYGQAVFDGLKGFRAADGEIRLFRPDAHARRLRRSAERLAIPPIPEEWVEESFLRLVDIDRRWVPGGPGTAIYIRPTIIASEPAIGLHTASSYLYFVILSPVGAYYAQGANPVSILATEEFVRAAPGGLGEAKTPANYAASLLAAERAEAAGFTQVLWLDAVEHRWVEEVGTMNLMVRIGEEVVTPPLGGTILPGVTRDSALRLMRSWGLEVSERPLAIEALVAAAKDGTLSEVWGTGTAAVVSPVGEIGWRGERISVADAKPGALTHRLYQALTGIQYGTAPDPFGWTVPVPVYN